MTLDAKARVEINEKLQQSGLLVQDLKLHNFGASIGVTVTEFPTNTGPANFELFVNFIEELVA